MVGCGTRPSLRVRARASPLQPLLRGGYRRSLHEFQGGQRHHRRSDAPQEENGGKGARGETAGEPSLPKLLWDMLYADDAVVISKLTEQVMKMMGLVMVVYTAFCLTESETKTEVMCLRTKGIPEAASIMCRGSQLDVKPNERVHILR